MKALASLLSVAALSCGSPASNPLDAGQDSGTPDAATGEWVVVPAGSFTMGTAAGQPCRYVDEVPHVVTLNHAFEIAATEVTQGQFTRLQGYNPSTATGCGADCPVEHVTWHEAAAYCTALSLEASLASCYTCSGAPPNVTCAVAIAFTGPKALYTCPGYRLPMEAEWEYACRAGTTGGTYDGDITVCTGVDSVADRVGWYAMNSGGAPHPVRGKLANPWGLYDMAGNVWEWVNDFYVEGLGSSATTDPWQNNSSGGVRVFRGGAFSIDADAMRSAFRDYNIPEGRGNVGFRCVRSL